MDAGQVDTFAPALPFLAWLVTLPWLLNRVRELQCKEKQLVIYTSLLTNYREWLSSNDIEDIEKDVKFICRNMIESSPRLEQERLRAWRCRVGWKRFLTVPPPKSPAGRIAKAMFYLYGLAAVVYFAIAVVSWALNGSLPGALIVYGISWAVISALFRIWCVRHTPLTA